MKVRVSDEKAQRRKKEGVFIWSADEKGIRNRPNHVIFLFSSRDPDGHVIEGIPKKETQLVLHLIIACFLMV